jgi:hypothetical protein
MLEPHLAEKKTTKKKQNSDTLNPQSIQSFPKPRYTEKTGGLPHLQTPAPNLLGKCRPTGEQISGMWYSHSILRANLHSPLDRLTPAPQKKKKQRKKTE